MVSRRRMQRALAQNVRASSPTPPVRPMLLSPLLARGRLLLLVGLLAACRDVTSPADDGGAVTVAFMDHLQRLNTVRSGEMHRLTGVQSIVPFAAFPGAVAYFVRDSLQLYHLADGFVETLPITRQPSFTTAGAVAPDGERLAWASGTEAGIFIHVVNVRSGVRDSVDITDRDDAPAALQAVFSLPVWSPSGDSVAFLLPNVLTVQLLIYEVRTNRLEVHPMPVAASTLYRPLVGWPRWSADASIRFLAQLRNAEGVLTDTLVVLRVFPRSIERPAEQMFRSVPPEGITITDVGAYSFDAPGETVAFALVTPTRQVGLFSFRRSDARFRTVMLDPLVRPTSPLLVP